ncbi:MAG: hypothetical protein R3C05_22675 [Pirellulaceae bacterium]
MSYIQYWRLRRMPFGEVQGRDDFFEGSSQREAVARLRFLVGNARSVGLLIGEAGTGRSSLLRHVGRNVLWTDLVVDAVLVSGSFDHASQWLQHLATQMNAEDYRRSTDAWRRVCEAMDSASRQDVHSCLLIDDASPAVAQAAGLLVNRTRHATAVLSCTADEAPDLLCAIGGCPLRIDIPDWSLSDSSSFIRQSLINAGGDPETFADAAIVRIHELSEGRVAALCKLAQLSLLAGAGARATQITPEIVEAIQSEMLVAA